MINKMFQEEFMYKNLLILGPSRCGKSTLAKLICEQYDCNSVNLNNIQEIFEKTFPNTEDYNKYLKQFMINYIEQLTDYKTFYSGRKTVIECNVPFIEDIINNVNQDNTAIIGITYDNIDIDYFAQKIKYSDNSDYLQFLSPDGLKSRLQEFVEESKEMNNIFNKLDINTYDVSNNRDEVFKEVLDDVEELTKYGGAYKIKKRN